MEMKLAGKVALVTGAARDVGREIALSLAAEGAAVAVNYNGSKEGAANVVAEIKSKGGKAVAYQADVSDFSAVKDMVAMIADGLRRTGHRRQQCRRGAAQPLRRYQAGGMAEADRRLPVRLNSHLEGGGAASGKSGNGRIICLVGDSSVWQVRPCHRRVRRAPV